MSHEQQTRQSYLKLVKLQLRPDPLAHRSEAAHRISDSNVSRPAPASRAV
jgi:hypothetical protein